MIDWVPVLAHGVGGRSDLPLPFWLVVWGAVAAIVISFAITSWFWPEARLARHARGVELGRGGQIGARAFAVLLRIVGLASFALMLVATLWGDASPARNIAPTALFIWFWVGLQVVSAVLGDVWRALSPFETIGLAVERLRPESSAVERRRDPGQWTAAAFVFSFVWLELAYFESSSPRAIGIWLVVYSVAVVVGLSLWGRGWLRYGEGFAGLFGLLAHLGVFFTRDRRIRARWPVTGLAAVPTRPGTAALLMVVLGSTAFDGLSRTTFWVDAAGSNVGWTRTAWATVGLVWMIGVVSIIYVAATRGTARVAGVDTRTTVNAFVPSLIPIALGYTIAHYFSLVLLEGQGIIYLASDPFGQGWDLFATRDYKIDYQLVSTTLIASVQAGAIVAGHIVGVVAAHDRAVELFPRDVAVRSQYSLLAAMVLYTVGALVLLLG